MKKAAIIFLVVVAAPVLAWAAWQWNGAAVTVWNGASVSAWNGVTVAATPSYVLKDSQDSYSGSQSLSAATGYQYLGASWTSASAYNLRRIDVYLRVMAGDVSGVTYTVNIYSDDGAGKPNSILTNGTATFSGSTVPGSLGYVPVYFDNNVSISNGTRYHYIIHRGGTVDASNYINLGYNVAGTEFVSRSTNASTWTTLDGTAGSRFKTYSYE